ncbi:MAG: cobalt ECF transporter T component CbiQ [Thermodesulfobacteria bacterium]|nr:cobalt ECF transporter T component CbiQ [Thermodesulfobacteriota bacterium]
MTCERMAKGESLLHLADPRVKIIAALVLSLELVFLECLLALIIALLCAILMLLITDIDKRLLAKRLAIVNVFLVFLWLVIPISTPGDSIFRWGPLNITDRGVFLCTLITVKCNAIVMFNIALLSTSSIFSLAHALDHLKVPPVLVQLFFFSWRYLHVLEEEYARIKRAALLRGFQPGSNLLTYKTYANILGTLFVRSYDRGQRVYWAMVCRGFNGTFWLLSHFELKPRDFFLILWTLVLASSLIFLQWSMNCH